MSRAPSVIVGAGYLGARVAQELNASTCTCLGRSSGLNLDTNNALPVALPPLYQLLYTVPPAAHHDADRRLQRLLELLELLDAAPLGITYISTTGVYGDHAGAVVDEDAVLQADTGRAKRRVSAETILQAWTARQSVALTILRAPGIYGPGRLGLERIENGDAVIRESDAFPGNRIHVTDLVNCCIAAMHTDAPAGIYNVGDGDHRSPTWFTQEVARQANLAMPPEISRAEAAKTSAESRIVDTTRMREKLGVQPKYANAENGIRASLAFLSGLAANAAEPGR